MRIKTSRGLLACLCAGILAIPALASDPPLVGFFNPNGKIQAIDGLACTTPDGVTHKIASNGNGTFSLDMLDATGKVTLRLNGEDIELTVPAGVHGIAIYQTPSGPAVKYYTAGAFGRMIAAPTNGNRSVVAAHPAPPVGAIPRSIISGLSLRGGGGADDCASAQAISGDGTFAVDNSAATTDGPNDPACSEFGLNGIGQDVWFCWTAGADGTATVTTCGGITFDSKIAAYDGCGCPVGPPLACNDDDCSLQSSIQFPVVNGQSYMIRIGSYPGSSGTQGSGTFDISTTTGGGGMGGSDDCSTAEAISGQGLFAFDNSAATTDGVPDPSCDFFGADDIENDVWYCWTADDDGLATVQTCGQTAVDTKMAAYDGCGCPSGTGILACNDDSCSLQSSVSFPVTNGNTYLLRIGNFPGATDGPGSGNIDISIGTPPPPGDCNEPAENCHTNDTSNALNSDGADFVVADDFSPATSGTISSICWWGTYFDGVGDCGGSVSDNFTVNYYADSSGLPGALLASFSQSGGTLTITRGTTPNQIAGFLPEYEYTGQHDPVSVTAGECYWIEIVNPISGCAWFWEIGSGGNGRGLQDGAPPNGYSLTEDTMTDLAYCLDVELGDDTGCIPPPPEIPCDQPAANCQANDVSDALNSTAGLFTAADDFQVPASRATVNEVCWWGGYYDGAGDCSGAVTNDFTVTYYADAGGVPGALIASYSQSGGTLTVTGPVATGGLIAGFLPEYNFTGAHAPLALNEGDCVWIEITNDIGASGCSWFWTIASEGNGQAMQDGDLDGYQAADRVLTDLAFCLDSGLGDSTACLPPPPDNDDCSMAEDIPCNGSATGDNSFATNDATDPGLSCHFDGPGNHADGTLWYTFVATDTSAFIETNNSAVPDTQIGVYDGTCGSLTEIGCSEDEGDGLLSEVCVDNLSIGTTYYIQVGVYPTSPRGSITVDVTCPCPPPAENDLCENAIAVAVPSTTPGSTDTATTDFAPTCDTSNDSPGVWYRVMGTGNTMTASLCDGATTYDSKLSVYCDDCDALPCVAGNDDFCGLQSQVSWCSQLGASYLILVHGFSGATGDFDLTVSDDGVACSGAVACLPTGACCTIDGSCLEVTPDVCDSLGGDFQGVGTTCGGGSGYTVGTGSAFEDISGTGTLLPLGDDDGAFVSIGFAFNFYGTDYKDVAIGSNGYLTFSSDDLTDLSEDPIPNTTLPNNIIAVLWDDLDPGNDGSPAAIYYQTLGTAPNRRFIAQYTDVPEFPDDGANTAQAVLYEGTNCVELRYQTITTVDYVSGIENADGTEGVDVTSSATEGSSIELCPVSAEPPCPPGGACCFVGGVCVQLTEAECNAQGGNYQGDGSSCGGENLGYAEATGDAFEDISGSGTLLPLGDDDGAFGSIGFDFNFFGNTYSDVAIGSNGYLTFSSDDLTDLSEDPIPNANLPNNIIAVLWDDLDPGNDGSPAAIYYETLGTAPNRRFIAQYTDVPEFPDTGANTAQAVLYEGTNCVELRYQTITTLDYVAGIENADGSDGVDVTTSAIEGASIQLCPQVTENPCPLCAECPPGTFALTDAQGDFAGWCLASSHPDQVAYFVDAVVPGNFALFEISKDFVDGPGTGGLITPILIDFIQVCPDEYTAPMLYIADETITNQTGVDWSDYHWILFDGTEAWFDVDASSGFSVAPFASSSFDNFIDANRARELDAFDGVVPAGTSFFAGDGAGELKIGVDLSNPDPVSFTLKQRPTIPEVNCVDFSVDAPGTFTGNTTGAGDDCDVFGSDSEDHIYEVTLPNDGEWTFSLCGSSYDTKIEVGTTCCSADVGSNDDDCGLQSSVTASLTAGTYYVTVDGYSGATGDYVLDISKAPACPIDFSVSAPGTFMGDTTGADDSCDLTGGDGADHIYEVTIPNDGTWIFALCGSSFDTKMTLGTSCCSDDIAYNDDSCGLQSSITATLTAGTYYVTVDGFGGATGAYTLDISEAPACAFDFAVNAPGTFMGDTTSATDDCDTTSLDGPDDVYQVMIPSDGMWTFSLCGSSYDTKMQVGTTCCSEDIGYNDDFCDLQSSVTAAISAGTYYVTVDGFNGATGAYTLDISLAPPAPATTPDVDVRPGIVPNLFTPGANGVLDVSVQGSATLDATQVDLSTVTLMRQDGVGVAIPAYQGVGPQASIYDVESDGYADMVIPFATRDVESGLKLYDGSVGEKVVVILAGQLLDGTPFKGLDSIRLETAKPGATQRLVSVGSTAAGVWVDATTDGHQDAGGFAAFNRVYDIGSQVNLTAPESMGNAQFIRWRVNGVAQADGVRDLSVTVTDDMDIRAVYRAALGSQNAGGRRLLEP